MMNLEALTTEERRLFAMIHLAPGPFGKTAGQADAYDAYRHVHRNYADLASSSYLMHWRHPDLAGSNEVLEPLKRALFIQWYANSGMTGFGGVWTVDKQAEFTVLSIINRLAHSHALDNELCWMIPYYSHLTASYFVIFVDFRALLKVCRQHRQIP